MFFLYFLITFFYIDMLKYLKSFPLDISITIWHYLHQDAEKTWITWIDHDVTRYHNLNALPHALQHAFPYILSQFHMDRP